jgi:hypothetical protein
VSAEQAMSEDIFEGSKSNVADFDMFDFALDTNPWLAA